MIRALITAIAVVIPRIDESITIDGDLTKAVWQRAAVLTGFTEYAPADGRPAEDSTEVRVWYSPTAIYFGIKAYEAHGAVHATLANRDNIDADDNVKILLDTFHSGRRALVFGVNPLGIQEDGTMVEGEGTGPGSGFSITNRPPTDLSPDFVYESKGHLTPFGYEVEVRIPFKSIKFPRTDPQDWGINIIRTVQHSGHVDTWAPVKRAASSFLGQGGTLTGLTELHRALVLDVNPIVTEKSIGSPKPGPAGGRASGNGWRYTTQHPEFGGNIRYGLTSNLVLNGTVNPDFAEVEADAAQLIFDPRIALFYTEKRPFFLDGLEQFTTPNTLIYTRRIVEPVGAAKLTGSIAGTSVAFLSAADDRTLSATGRGNPLFTIVRLQHDLGPAAKLGVVATDREDGGTFNRLGGLDAHVPFGGTYAFDAQTAVSDTRAAGQSAVAPLWEAHLARLGHSFGFDYIITGIDPRFEAASGFIPRPGVVHADIEHHVTTYGAPHAFVENTFNDIQLDGTWQYDNFVHARSIEEALLHFNNSVTLRGGWKIAGDIYFESFGYDSSLFRNYYLARAAGAETTYTRFTGTPHISNTDYVVQLVTPQFKTLSASVFYLWGRDENFAEWSAADIGILTATADWRPTNALRVSATYNLQRYHRHSDGSTVGLRRIPYLKVEYQLARSIFFRVVGQYDAEFQDDLRDDSRTNLPIFVLDPATHTYTRATAASSNSVTLNGLFSYQPVPGTVFFLGYGDTAIEPSSFGFNRFRRTADQFFIKCSYLFRA